MGATATKDRPANTPERVQHYAEAIVSLAGPVEGGMILRRALALLEGGEQASSIAVRLNGPARPPRGPDGIARTIEAMHEPTPPSRSDVAAFGRLLDLAHRTDLDAARDARLRRELDRTSRGRHRLTGAAVEDVEAKAPKSPPPPKPEPVKPRPVKRPAPQRKGSTRPGGVVLAVIEVDGARFRVGECGACGERFRHPVQRGRFPLKCGGCR